MAEDSEKDVEDNIDNDYNSEEEREKNRKKFRYDTKYKSSWENTYAWLSKARISTKALCKLCNKEFSINQGLHQVKQHQNTTHHKTAVSASRNNNLIDKFCKADNSANSGDQLSKNAALELACVYHNVKHNLSYSSLDCGFKLNKHMLKDTTIMKTASLGRTKAEAIAKNVLAPKALQMAVEDLKNHFFSVQCDASNIKNRKYFPVAVQYFNDKSGVVNKLINFVENPDESASGMFNMIQETLTSAGLSFEYVSSLSADNCNANFGNNNSLYTHMLVKNKGIFKANCHAHIIHNSVKKIINELEYDVENLILKVYSHFSVSAKRRETLKEFSEFVNIAYSELLRHVTTRWLSLTPCIDRVLKCWPALLSYFMSLRDCPKPIQKLLYITDYEFEINLKNSIPEIYLLFCSNLFKLFDETICKLESNHISVLQIFTVFEELYEKLVERKNKKFFGFLVQQKLKELEIDKARNIEQNFVNALNKTILYLTKWFNFQKEENWLYRLTKLTLGKSCLEYEDVCRVVEIIPEPTKFMLNLDIDKLFDEITTLNKILNLIKNNIEYQKIESEFDKWLYIFQKCDLPNMYKLMSFILSMPVSTAFVERTFSTMTNKWTEVRNRSSVDLIKAELLITFNFQMSCVEFFDFVSNDKKMLQNARSHNKYS